jgi:hypothetical protein
MKWKMAESCGTGARRVSRLGKGCVSSGHAELVDLCGCMRLTRSVDWLVDPRDELMYG